MASLYDLFLLRLQRKDYHNSVSTLSIGAWLEVQKTKDLSNLINKSIWIKDIYYYFFPVRKDQTLKSLDIWEQVQDSYIQLIGIGDKLEELKYAKLKLHEHLCKRHNNPFEENWIAIWRGKIKKLEKEIYTESEVSNEESIIVLEENMRLHIDTSKMTVEKYHNLLDYWIKRLKPKLKNAE